MAHSSHFQIGKSILAIEVEVGKLLDLAETLKEAGDIELARAVVIQAQKLVEAAVGLRIAMVG